MRGVPVLLAGLLSVWVPAHAQVTTNDGALDSLAPPRAPAARPHPTHRVTPKPTPQTAPRAAAPATPAPAPTKTVRPAIPVSPPAILALPPAVAVPLAHPPPPPVVPLADDAPGTVTPLPNGLRITFGPDRADMSPATAATLAKFAGDQLSQTSSINVFAYAAGSAEDPSAPRRLSLQRALAARAVLLNAGIPSPRIYPRALGPASAEEPDRVDVVTGSPTPPAAGRVAIAPK